MIVGTAGHIDHGKTTLVKALTGVDADRLPEEKARGITLDLGYAYTPLPTGEVLGFIDVPGHEKLIHNMLAGATGMDFVLLVIAADDGPMPQTREQLEIIDLLGIRCGAVALTKCDVVDAARLEAVQIEIATLLERSSLEGCPVFPLSATSGEGVAELRTYLEGKAGQVQRKSGGHFRLAIDRSFSLAGAGTVVTGTAFSGEVTAGDTVTLLPGGMSARVRSLHVQDRAAERGRAGERCALALVGNFGKADLTRGLWVVDAAFAAALGTAGVSRLQAEVRVPLRQPALKHWSAVHVHLGADDIPARIALLDIETLAPGEAGLCELILERPTVAVRGDAFVLRDAGAQRNVGGGRVLDVFPPTRHKRAAARLALLRGMANDDPAVILEHLAAETAVGVDLTRFAINWNLNHTEAAALWQRVGLKVVPSGNTTLAFTEARWLALGARLLEVLVAEHQRAADMAGVERERLRRMTDVNLARPAFDRLVNERLASGELAQTRAWLHLPGHRVTVSAGDRDLFAVLRPLLDASPNNPPRVRDVFHATGTAEDTVRQLFRRIARSGELYPVAQDHYFTADAVKTLAGIVARLCREQGAARAAALRDEIGGGRKVAIQILEFFDRIGYTRRVRDDHVLREHLLDDAADAPWIN